MGVVDAEILAHAPEVIAHPDSIAALCMDLSPSKGDKKVWDSEPALQSECSQTRSLADLERDGVAYIRWKPTRAGTARVNEGRPPGLRKFIAERMRTRSVPFVPKVRLFAAGSWYVSSGFCGVNRPRAGLWAAHCAPDKREVGSSTPPRPMFQCLSP